MENHEVTSSNLEEKTIIQLIVFRTGEEEFGVPIEEVREIIKMGTITPIPNALKFIKGIINVRGEIVTIIDIKKRFNLPIDKNSQAKHIIVSKQEETLFGLMVDEVIEVLRIKQKDIKSPPPLISKINEKYIKNVVSHEGRLIILLDLLKILSQDELLMLAQKLKGK